MENTLSALLYRNQHFFHPVMTLDPSKEHLCAMDFTSSNKSLTPEVINSTDRFSSYVSDFIKDKGSRYGIGGYKELRTVYDRSSLFGMNENEEPRRLHLGVDIWGAAGTPVFAFMGGMVHSVAFNDHYGDYGATIILTHQLEGTPFYTLYGHISLRDIASLHPGQYITRGEEMAHLGNPTENGQWPPHLHFQVIADIGLNEGDYPGVCRWSERDKYLENCPDPDLILNWNRYIK